MSSTQSKLVLDAHTIIWFVAGDNQRLSTKVKDLMSRPDADLVLPAIALAEACWAIERGKTAVPSVSTFLTALDKDSRLTIVPLSRAIIELSGTLTSIAEMHDRQIAATALLLQRQGLEVALATRDSNITQANVVPVLW